MVQLTIGEDLIDQVLHQSLNARGGGVPQGARGRLNHICQHDQAGLTGLGPWPRISEIIDIDCILAFYDFGFSIKITDQAGAVVLLDGIDDHLPEFVFTGDLDAVFHMGNQDQCRHGRGQLVVLIPAV